MISELSFKNFKSWQSFDKIKISNLTAFFGTNSSGKTSIIDLLLLLKQTIESTDRSQVLEFGGLNQYRQLGSFTDIIYNHDPAQTLNFEIKLKYDKIIKIKDTEEKANVLFQDDTLIFSADINQIKSSKRIFVQEMNYLFDNQKFNIKKQEKDKYDYKLSSKSLNEGRIYNIKRTPGRVWRISDITYTDVMFLCS